MGPQSTRKAARPPSFEDYGGSAPENYERYFVPAIGAPLALELVEAAGLAEGERVLDAACGTGIVARLAAERVGPTGTIAGLDINRGMLTVARLATPRARSVEWHEASAEATSLTGHCYDAVLCQMGLQFFPDKVAALREMRRLLKPGGRVVLNVPGPTPEVFSILARALARHVGPEAAGFVHQVFSLYETRQVDDLLSAAGFREVAVRRDPRTLQLPPPAPFLWQYVHGTPLAAAVGQLEPQDRDDLEHDVVGAWRSFAGEEGLVLRLGVTVASARMR